MRKVVAVIILLLITQLACSLGQESVDATRVETQVEVTREVEVTRIVERVVTATFTPVPENTPTPPATPTPEVVGPTPDLTQTAPKDNGIFTVGVDIAPGKWLSTGTEDDCFWARLDANQDSLDSHFGDSGGTVTIREGDYQVEFEDCGTWEYIEGVTPILQDDAAEPKSDGFYRVNAEIVPGQWQSTGTTDDCYWARLDAYQDTLDNHFGLAGGVVVIQTNDYEVHFDDCGVWEYLGP